MYEQVSPIKLGEQLFHVAVGWYLNSSVESHAWITGGRFRRLF